MRAFVTGGSGFVGRNLIAALRARGDDVVALARSESSAKAVRDAGATAASGDLDDEAAMKDAMRGADVVFHSAAKVGEWGDAREFEHVNVGGTERVIAAARAAGVPCLVHVSTEAVLTGGGPIRDADESRPIVERPVGLYARTKAAAETRVRAASSRDLRAVVVRPRFVWGRGDTTLLPELVAGVKTGRLRWIDGGRYLTSTCHVTNVCEGLLLAADRGAGGEVYFVTDGPPVEFRAFITAMLETQGVDPGARTIPRWLAYSAAAATEATWRALSLRGAPPATRMAILLIGEEVTVNDAKARRDLGYVGRVSREQGLAEMRAR